VKALRSRSLSLLLLGGALLSAGCGGDDPRPTHDPNPGDVPFKETVTITKDGFKPRTARVLVGGSITWINRDPTGEHTAESLKGQYDKLPGGQDASFDTHTLSWGEPYTVTFHVPGSYEYESSVDEWRGRIDVVLLEPPPQ
jgi:plastocyanin